MLAVCDDLFGFGGSFETEFHVGLTGTDPDVANENVAEGDCVGARKFHALRGFIGYGSDPSEIAVMRVNLTETRLKPRRAAM
jgi:hypothetical protein